MAEVMAINNFSLILHNGDLYRLNQPEWLWIIPLFLLLILIVGVIKTKYKVKSAPTSFVDASAQQVLLHPLIYVLPIKTKVIKSFSSLNIIYVFIFCLFTLALTQPVKIGTKLPEPPQERDIIFIVDTSVSMILRDYILNGVRIDRMSLLKGVLDKFIVDLKGDKMSIIVFGDQAYTLVPLTSDQYLLRRMLSRVQATMAGRFNAIGHAIALAVKQASLNKEESKRKKILVLLTDADQPTGEINPLIAAQLAKKEHLPLYTIAIGATTLSAEEHRQGGLLYSPVNLELIDKLSSITGAKSYHAGDSTSLDKAIQEINLHETNKRDVKPIYFLEPLYHWPLIVAFIIFTLVQLTRIIKSSN